VDIYSGYDGTQPTVLVKAPRKADVLEGRTKYR
jgi:hypothetical protein